MSRLSLRRNFAWNLTGNVVFNLAQVLLLVAVARIGGVGTVGQFALMLAIAAPVFLTVGLNLRVVRATDVERRWTHQQYSRLRWWLNLVATAVTMVVGVALGLDGVNVLALLFVCVSKSAEAASLVIYGYMQLRERMDLVARSMIARALLGVAGFVCGGWSTGELAPACAGLATAWLIVWLALDRPAASELRAAESVEQGRPEARPVGSTAELVRKAVPLGADTGVLSLAANVPRYAVEIVGGAAALGVFATAAYFAQAFSTLTGALGDAVVAPLAKHSFADDRAAFTRLLVRLIAFALAVSGAAMAAAWLVGGWLTSRLMGPEFVDQPVLVLMMAAAGATTLQRSLGRGLHARHLYRQLLVVDVGVLVVVALLALVLTPAYGSVGAALSPLIAFAVGAVACLALLVRSVTAMRPQEVTA
jgi:O-antigen/teichoic acid export membrane protein